MSPKSIRPLILEACYIEMPVSSLPFPSFFFFSPWNGISNSSSIMWLSILWCICAYCSLYCPTCTVVWKQDCFPNPSPAWVPGSLTAVQISVPSPLHSESSIVHGLHHRAGNRKPLPKIVMMEQSPGVKHVHPQERRYRKNLVFWCNLERLGLRAV